MKFKPEIRHPIEAKFSNENLESICFDLNVLEVAFDNLEGGAKSTKIVNLLIKVDQLDLTTELFEILKKLRPKVNWDHYIDQENIPVISDQRSRHNDSNEQEDQEPNPPVPPQNTGYQSVNYADFFENVLDSPISRPQIIYVEPDHRRSPIFQYKSSSPGSLNQAEISLSDGSLYLDIFKAKFEILNRRAYAYPNHIWGFKLLTPDEIASVDNANALNLSKAAENKCNIWSIIHQVITHTEYFFIIELN